MHLLQLIDTDVAYEVEPSSFYTNCQHLYDILVNNKQFISSVQYEESANETTVTLAPVNAPNAAVAHGIVLTGQSVNGELLDVLACASRATRFAAPDVGFFTKCLCCIVAW